jgi:hypothetical protein
MPSLTQSAISKNALQRSVTQDSLQTKQNTRNALAQAYQAPIQDRADQDAGMMGVPRPVPPPEQVGMAVAAAGGSPSVSLPLINKGMGLDEAPEYQKTGAFLAEGPDGEPMIVVGIVNKATGRFTHGNICNSRSPINFKNRRNARGATAARNRNRRRQGNRQAKRKNVR